jgi:hypothetical protein
MFTLKYDAQGVYQVVPPEDDAGIVELGTRYVDYEQASQQPVREPSLDLIRAAVQEATLGLSAAQTEEFKRSESATAYHNAMTTAMPLLLEAFEQLKWKYRANLGKLERWGLDAKMGTQSKVLVRKPAKELEWANFLLAYTAQEQLTPPLDQINPPDLNQLIELANVVKANKQARDEAVNQRKIGVQKRTESAQRLFDLLQAACAILIITRYQGRVTTDLGVWGFNIQAIRSKPAESIAPEPAPAEPAA